jgi:hypothetical protein
MSCVDKYFDRVTVTMYSHEEQVLFRSEGAVISRFYASIFHITTVGKAVSSFFKALNPPRSQRG